MLPLSLALLALFLLPFLPTHTTLRSMAHISVLNTHFATTISIHIDLLAGNGSHPLVPFLAAAALIEHGQLVAHGCLRYDGFLSS